MPAWKFRASDVYLNVDQVLDEAGVTQSVAERHLNLSSSWSNYAQALIFSNEIEPGLHSFLRSLEHAYLGGNSVEFLNNSFQYSQLWL